MVKPSITLSIILRVAHSRHKLMGRIGVFQLHFPGSPVVTKNRSPRGKQSEFLSGLPNRYKGGDTDQYAGSLPIDVVDAVLPHQSIRFVSFLPHRVI